MHGLDARTFHADDILDMEDWIQARNGTHNIYFQVNPSVRDLNKKSTREDIESLAWLQVDLDPRPREDLATEQALCLALLTTSLPASVPPPTLVINSGGGVQGFWKLEEPIKINGNVQAAEDASRYSRQLQIIFGDRADNTHNVDRIMRLPGTVNVPDAAKRRKGRTEALARVVEFDPARVYSIDTFTPAPDRQLDSLATVGTGPAVEVSGNVARLNDINELNEWGVKDRVKALIVQGDLRHLEGPKKEDDSRSAWLFDAVCSLVRDGVPDEIIFSIITDPDMGISASVIDKGSNARLYAIQQIKNAKLKAINPQLLRLNQRHAVIGNIGGRCRVIEEVMDHALGRARLTRQSFDDFRNRYMGESVMISQDPQKGPKFMPLGHWWLSNPNRRYYDTIVFAPNKEIQGVYNLWRGFAVDARPGNCDLFLEHIRVNICRGNQEHYDYMIRWMARAVQHPDSPGHTAIVLRGNQGTGKSFFAKTFGSLWGRHFLQVSDPKHLVGSFNAHLRDCVVLFGDEAFYAGDKKHESILKTLVTEETIMIEGKGVDAEAAPNYVHLILASNNQWVVPAGADDRRYFVLDVGHDRRQDTSYFRAITDQMNNGGREALLHMLMTLDLKEFNIRSVPRTTALQEQKILSLAPEEEWWYTNLMEGRVLREHEGWEKEVLKDALLDDYVEYMKRVGINRRASPTALGKFLSRICPPGYPKSYQKMATVRSMGHDGYEITKRRRAYFYEFPPLGLCRERWDQVFSSSEPWPDEISREGVAVGESMPF